MFEQSSRRLESSASPASNRSELNFGVDLNRDPVYLSGRVKPSEAFAAAMLTLGKVVKIQRRQKKDNSAYQQWVTGEYLKTLNQRMPGLMKNQAELLNRQSILKADLQSQSGRFSRLIESKRFNALTRRYFYWLYEHDRQAWVILDPIVSVQSDGTFFEAFSGDESIYARVFLPHSGLATKGKPILGTTNIDFSMLLERELDRVRSYRPMDLTVGLKAVQFKTSAAAVEEEKIPLPESWVRGLVEVQSVLALAPTVIEISSDALAEIIARLESEKEKTGPRWLKFVLNPGEPIRIEIEPWGDVFTEDWFTYQGKTSTEIRIWGRRRLSVLKEALVMAQSVRVHFLGSGMPSFWSIEREGVELTIGLSGWTNNDWASKAKFSSFVPALNVSENHLHEALKQLMSTGVITTQELGELLGTSTAAAASVLQKLCLSGKAMFDPVRGVYRWRDLFPTIDLQLDDEVSRELTAGVELMRDKKVKVTLDDQKDGVRYLAATVSDLNGTYSPILELDLDNRPKHAQCTCPFYNYNRLKQGPCRHMIALMAGDEN
jgi:hypothetical protein